MAKLKTKKSKQTFKEGIEQILESHNIHIDRELLDPLLADLETFFNNTFKPDNTTKYWSELVSQYVDFYLKLTGEKPAFNPIQAAALKKLNKTLMNRYLSNVPNSVWDRDPCLRQQLTYYNACIELDFYRKNFCVALINNNFDMITAQLSDKRKNENKN